MMTDNLASSRLAEVSTAASRCSTVCSTVSSTNSPCLIERVPTVRRPCDSYEGVISRAGVRLARQGD